MSAEAATLPGYSAIPPGMKPLLLLVGVAAAVAAGVMIVLWSRGPNFSLLYGDLGSADQAAVAQALDTAGIPYRLDAGSNGISVPSERLADARLKLAGQGLPEGNGGFAVMGKDPGFGISQFMENARYQHALETELARTIASLRPVEGARVHLAVPRQSAFVRDRQAASASVFVQMKAGRRLEQEQIQSIVNLVASSIPELEANQVTVVDQQGRLLSAPQGDSEAAQRQQQFELAERLEEEYSHRIESILTPFVGPGRVKAQVVAQLDNSVTEEAREQYRPGSQIVRSEQTSEQLSKDGDGSQGVPGALTNQPPAGGTALPPASAAAVAPKPAAAQGTAGQAAAAAAADAAAATATPDNVSREASRNYEIDRTLAYTRQPSGRLQRLTVAVLIDNVRTTDKEGKVTEKPLAEPQLARITQLVKDAVGFNAERGDSVNVVNSSFREEAPVEEGELEQVPLWERPLVQNIAKLLAGLIALMVLIFMVVRPLVRGLLAQSREAPQALAHAEARASLAQAAQGQPLAYEQQLAQARTLVGQDPKRVAQVVKTWVATDE